jgi:hypothetical protein
MELKEAIARWKELNLNRVILTFNCGGDNMGDMDWVLYDNADNTVIDGDLVDYFDTEVFKHVDFYVNSDGHYMGEAGTVTVELEGEEDDFSYSKDAMSEYEEQIESDLVVELTDAELAFVKEYVSNINGTQDNDVNFNYSKDFIMTDEMVGLEDSIGEKICNTASEFTPEDIDGDISDWYNYETSDTVEIKDNTISLIITNSYYTQTESEW